MHVPYPYKTRVYLQGSAVPQHQIIFAASESFPKSCECN